MLGGSHATLPNSRIFEEVSRLVAAPRRPSTNRVYDDRWLRYAHWAAGQGIYPLGPTAAQTATFLYYLFDNQGLSPKSIKRYRSCLALVLSLNCGSHAMSDMITSMELQRPRITPVVPQWDLDIIQEALSKPPYVLLRKVSLKQLTFKTVFFPAMASAGRCSELQALVFDPQYIQFKPKRAGVTIYFKNQRPNQVNDPWYIPAVLTGKPDIGAYNCPVRALKYCHRCMAECLELKKGRHCLFIIRYNKAGKDLSAASISCWICTTIGDSHATI